MAPDSSEEYVPLDRKAKRRLIQRQYNRKRKKQKIKAKQFSRNANPTVRARHNDQLIQLEIRAYPNEPVTQIWND